MRRGVVALVVAGVALAGGAAWLATRGSPGPPLSSVPPPRPTVLRDAAPVYRDGEPRPCSTLDRGPSSIEPRVWDPAVGVLARYLSDDPENRTSNWNAIKTWNDAKAKAGNDPLADVGGLLDAIYKSRPFDGAWEKRQFRNGRFEVDRVRRITSLQNEELRFSYSLPPAYPDDARKLKRGHPFPTIVTLHDLVDFREGTKTKDFPGLEAIQRRYPRDGPMKAVTEEWMIFAPVATRAQFDVELNRRIVSPFSEFWKRFHVDFDRVVLDGGDPVLRVATQIPVFFSGVIVRGDPGDLDPRLADNVAHLPIYVVGGEDAPATKWLRNAGLSPTVGDEAKLARWLGWVCRHPRKVPTSFRWHVEDPKLQILAHWVNINEAKAGATMGVAVDRATNTVRIDADRVEDVALFLNDEVVDLSRPVALVLNGREPEPARVYTRRLDTTFENKVVAIRTSKYYGWLYPVLLSRVKIPPR